MRLVKQLFPYLIGISSCQLHSHEFRLILGAVEPTYFHCFLVFKFSSIIRNQFVWGIEVQEEVLNAFINEASDFHTSKCSEFIFYDQMFFVIVTINVHTYYFEWITWGMNHNSGNTRLLFVVSSLLKISEDVGSILLQMPNDLFFKL